MKFNYFIIGLVALVLIAVGIGFHRTAPAQNPPQNAIQPQSLATNPDSTTIQPAAPANPIVPAKAFVAPISDASARTTKKFFGTYVTPQNSPVMPERFTGYHTGLDFETFLDEQNTDVAINAICSGKLLIKKYASGYGGVAVQACNLDGAAVTIIYGHLRLSSISPNVGDQLQAGEKFAVLGTGFSTETDGERKHLHLAIHKGSAINILGYVQQKSLLSGWIDPATVVQE